MKMILAVDLEGGLGKGGTIPWHYSSDLQRFKRLTKDCYVVMGKNTWNDPQFPKPLKDRYTIVLASDVDSVIDSHLCTEVWTGRSKILLTHHLKMLECTRPVWIIGGSSLYNSMIDQVDQVALTVIHTTHDCDTFFDKLDYVYDNFILIAENSAESSDYSFYIYDKTQ